LRIPFFTAPFAYLQLWGMLVFMAIFVLNTASKHTTKERIYQ